MHFFLVRQHTTDDSGIVMHCKSTHKPTGAGTSAARKHDVMVVLVKMSVSVPYTAEMRDEATRRELVDDIINLCKVGAQSHLTITGHTAEVS